MSNTRLKLFCFDAKKNTAESIEKDVNDFLSNPDIVAFPSDIIVSPDEFTIISVTYELRKKRNNKPTN